MAKVSHVALIGPADAGSRPGLHHQGLLTHGLHAGRMLWPLSAAVHAILGGIPRCIAA